MSGGFQKIAVSLVYTRTPWHEVPRARHYFAEALSKREPVAFLAANVWSIFPKLTLHEVANNYWLLQPSWFFPFKIRYRIPLLSRLYHAWLHKALSANEKLTVREVITFDHTSLSFVEKRFPYIYYVNDDHTRKGAKKFDFFAERLAEEESTLARGAELVIVTAEDLKQRFVQWNKNTHTIALGAPEVTVAPAMPETTNRTRLVFLGVLNTTRIPMDLLNSIQQADEYEIHCVGPADSAFKQWAAARSNVHLHQALTGQALLQFLQTCHVGIAPYKQNSTNSGVTPSKLWHYFAAGVPVVYSKLPSIVLHESYSEHALGANNDLSFLNAINTLCTTDTLQKRAARMQIAKENSWTQRVDQFLKLRAKP